MPKLGHLIRIQDIFFIFVGLGLALSLLAALSEFIRPSARTSTTPLGLPIRAFLIVQTALSVVCWSFLYAWRTLGYPFSTPFLPFFYLGDLNVFQPRFAHLHSAGFFYPSNVNEMYQYPGSVALLYEGFYATHYAISTFVLISGTGLLVLAFGLARQCVREGLSKFAAYGLVILTILMSYPLWFEYALGNLELCIFLMIAFGVVCYLTGRPYAAAVLFGVAAGMKIFPGVYLGLFLARRQFRLVVGAIVAAVLVNIAGLWMIGPNIPFAYGHVKEGLTAFRDHYMRTYLPQETGFDHSIFGFVKRATYIHFPGYQLPDSWVTVYLLLVALFGVSIYVLRIRKLSITNQIASLCVCSILLPPTSHDYTLIHLYIPWALLVVVAVRAARRGDAVPGLLAAMLCFALLFSSESELIRHARSFAGQVKCIGLLTLLALSLTFDWGSRDRLSSEAI